MNNDNLLPVWFLKGTVFTAADADAIARYFLDCIRFGIKEAQNAQPKRIQEFIEVWQNINLIWKQVEEDPSFYLELEEQQSNDCQEENG